MSSESTSKFENTGFIGLTILAGIAILVGLAYTLVSHTYRISSDPEAQTGVLIVLAVSIMILLLFIVAAGFRALGLSAKDQALGLPSGSVRAFIALILIMVFVILSVYAVRFVGEGSLTYIGTVSRAEALQFASDESFVVRPLGRPSSDEDSDEGDQFILWQVRPISEGGDRLAQQLVTTVATLVVAVAGFYFGAAHAQAALEQNGRVSTVPLIRDINPDSGKLGGKDKAPVTATLTGRNISAPESVRLVRDKETIEATDILFNDTTIQCKFSLPEFDISPGKKWDVVVEYKTGEESRLGGAFTIAP